MTKIPMKNPIAELDGDEMTRIIWKLIKDELLLPFIELNTEYFDLGLPHRDETDDSVTVLAAEAISRLGIGVKCATITPNAARVSEYGLRKMYKSPNATLRGILDGTVFRVPITVAGVAPTVRTWEKPITIARHAFGDVYGGTEILLENAAKAELVVTYADGNVECKQICDVESGVVQAMFNTDKSITSFARSCFNYALATKQDLWFATKDTISKIYDARFQSIFDEIFSAEYEQKFADAGIEYFYTLIDDAVARVIRSKGGYIWACKNYDGDVMSDMIASAFGSLAMMSSVLVSPDGNYEFEAAHGTVTRHYYRHLKGESVSTNPVATIFAWSGALKMAGQRENNAALSDFAEKIEKATIDTIESGVMTGDLFAISTLPNDGYPTAGHSPAPTASPFSGADLGVDTRLSSQKCSCASTSIFCSSNKKSVTTEEFIKEIRGRLEGDNNVALQ